MSGKELAEEQALTALSQVIDPEVGINVVDLGLIYAVDIGQERVSVRMTLTAPGCPMGGQLLEETDQALQRTFPGMQVQVELVWEPQWSPDCMSDAAKRQLGW